jgi:hypothetical protein
VRMRLWYPAHLPTLAGDASAGMSRARWVNLRGWSLPAFQAAVLRVSTGWQLGVEYFYLRWKQGMRSMPLFE